MGSGHSLSRCAEVRLQFRWCRTEANNFERRGNLKANCRHGRLNDSHYFPSVLCITAVIAFRDPWTTAQHTSDETKRTTLEDGAIP